MVDITALAGVIGISFAVAMSSELVQYLVVYRTSAFRTLKINLEKHAAKVEEARDANASKAVDKRKKELARWEEEAGKQLMAFNFKTGMIGMIFMVLGWRLVPRFFGGIAVARLPFEPPAFFQKATHRGLTGADPREASAIFIFMLCQASLRAVLPKVLGWGPTRRMTLVKPHIPKAMKMD